MGIHLSKWDTHSTSHVEDHLQLNGVEGFSYHRGIHSGVDSGSPRARTLIENGHLSLELQIEKERIGEEIVLSFIGAEKQIKHFEGLIFFWA